MTREEKQARIAQLENEVAALKAAEANKPGQLDKPPEAKPPAVTTSEPPPVLQPRAEQPAPAPEPRPATAGPFGAPASPAEEFALQRFFARQRSYQGEMERLARAEDHQEGFARALRGTARGRGFGFPFGNRRG
jgi:hypothetical protein